MFKYLPVALLCGFTAPALAAGDRVDYDINDNGLIEIHDLADLHELRNNLDGTTLYGSDAGCPVTGCAGVELMADLDFDTNRDGVIDAADAYWNQGQGWQPIGSYMQPYRGIVEGNGHVFRNLYIDRPEQSEVGVFGGLSDTTLRRTGVAGPLSYVRGYHLTGMLAGALINTHVEGVFSTGRVEGLGTDQVGGIAGYAISWSEATITNVFSTAQVTYRYAQQTAPQSAGGILGTLSEGTLDSSFALRPLIQNRSGGIVTSSHYVPLPGPASSAGGATLAELQCPSDSGAESCRADLYSGWRTQPDTDGNPYWDFGTAQQLPGLVLNGRVFRDGDGNGYLDEDADDNGSSNDEGVIAPAAGGSLNVLFLLLMAGLAIGAHARTLVTTAKST